MTRYISRQPPRSSDDDYYPEAHRTMTVHVTDDEPRDTGLVDSLGVPIMRLSDRAPMGFKK